MKVNISPKGTTTGKSVILGSQTLTDLENNRKGYIIVSTGLKANEEKSYDLRIWMDSSVTTEQGLNKNWAGKIVAVSNAAEEPVILAKAIFKNNKVQTPLTTPGNEVSAHVLDDVENATASVSTTNQTYYITYGSGWEANGEKFNLTGTAVTSDTYVNSYASLVGKYITSTWLDVAGSSTAGTMKRTTNLDSVYYVVSATSSSFVYKQISSNKNVTESLLASTEDDYGTSYYFRGAVKNNYVEFANKCWRIVRIIGDGSVKLILHNDNTTGAANPCDSANNSTSAAIAHYNGSAFKSEFNTSSGDNAYVGFMYGTAGVSDYESTHANINKSTILINLESWYNNNLKIYESVIDDSVWCNDKTNVTDTTFDPWSWNPNGLGYAKNNTYYGAAQRLISNSGSAGGTGPSLKCNGKLSKITSKIGLLTADELAYAGYAYGLENKSAYLQENATGSSWWTLSPQECLGTVATIYLINGFIAELHHEEADRYSDVRPSISLVVDTTISSGSGTSEDPYVVE